MIKNNLLLGLLLLATFFGCKKATKTPLNPEPPVVIPSVPSKPEALVFQSGFEPGMITNTNYPQIVSNPTAQGEDIKGTTINLANSNWIDNLETSSPVKYKMFRLNYEMGNYADRRAEIIPNPVSDVNSNSSANVLSFRLTNAVIPEGSVMKGRVAAEMFSQSLAPNATTSDKAVSSDIREYYQKVKFYLPTDFNLLQASSFPIPGAGDWLLLWEFRNHVPTTTGKDSRICVYITRPNNLSTTKFNFIMTCDEMGVNSAPVNIWKVENLNYKVTAGKWLEAEIYLKEGDINSGRSYFAVRDVNATNTGVWNKLCDKYATNVHRLNTNPTGFNGFNPMKLYCSAAAVKPFQDAGKSLMIYWDDLEIHENRLPTAGAITP
ncbi:hypothetical protein EZ428_18880 [Pedobacter frigiditerrae]|uniref:Polysaccharide lyase n=1 Tax=Pedobacter frigiditerrae TaxID=2530452 RepID=A0A4R0MPW9_9SPHI|nr:hypothetical protein [Pedobacter frigiditerrae]TCC88703.1 hypothetical protein EZ428_18880 [Pedobacter frigiditerrae]